MWKKCTVIVVVVLCSFSLVGTYLSRAAHEASLTRRLQHNIGVNKLPTTVTDQSPYGLRIRKKLYDTLLAVDVHQLDHPQIVVCGQAGTRALFIQWLADEPKQYVVRLTANGEVLHEAMISNAQHAMNTQLAPNGIVYSTL